MEIKLSWRYCLAFMAFVFVFGQLHEVAHLSVAYIICGCTGKQIDFNLWTFCADCINNSHIYIAEMAGPVFSYIMMWTGYFLLRSNNNRYWSLALVLIACNMAFARIFTAGMGRGDETTVLKVLLHGQSILLIKSIGFAVVFILSFPPLYMIYKRLANKNRLWTMLGLCFIPMCIMMPYEFMLLGKVLRAGFLAQRHFLGVADFIYLHTALMTMLIVIFRKSLFQAYSKSLT
ncbi:hypothetical protein [Mucilaginibacter sp.]|uniref:hypothetical protein n=1 Tax=Mucilaginibacter sp. TaxID=1882438 RepID=UPI00262DCC44|nr:hypothetical protein [Mucilaginibacter sp.]MDB4924046.1 hypothetical protein [Mucilaginibacter sp.]